MGTKNGRFWTRLAMPADGVSLEDEPEADKALRLLRAQREFVHSKHNVMGFHLDGKPMLLVKWRPEVSPNADLTPDASG